MSSNGIREARTGGGDLRCESQQVTGTKGNDWFVVWERGGESTHIGVRVDVDFPVDLEDCR